MNNQNFLQLTPECPPKPKFEVAECACGPPASYTDAKARAILDEYLKEDATLTPGSATQSILAIFPWHARESPEIGSFGELCIRTAARIPCWGSGHLKLALLLEQMSRSPKFGRGHRYCSASSTFACRVDPKSGEVYPFQQLCESLTKRAVVGGCLNEYVNYQAFMARLFEHRIFPTGVAFATRALREAFEVDHDEPHRSVYILGAAQWILWYGQTLSSLVWQRIHSDARPEFPVTAEHSLDRFTTEKWKLWKTRFREYQGNDECAKVAQKAACLMDALEKNLTSPHVDQPSTT